MTARHNLSGPMTATATAVLLAALIGPAPAPAQSVTVTQDLGFGAFFPGTGGTIVISTTGARSATGGVVLLTNSQFPAPTAATYAVANSAKNIKTFTLALPASATLTRSGGSQTMTVDTFTSTPAAGSSNNGRGFGGLTNGAGTIAIGATLNVNSAQAAGTYTGTFAITVTYP